jgi:membrane protein
MLLVLVLTTVYRAALPHSPPWRRLLPGRCWRWWSSSPPRPGCGSTSTVLTATGYTYGALATPVAFLLFAFLLGLSIVLGAQLNNAVQEVWPRRGPPAVARCASCAARRDDAAAGSDPARPAAARM